MNKRPSTEQGAIGDPPPVFVREREGTGDMIERLQQERVALLAAAKLALAGLDMLFALRVAAAPRNALPATYYPSLSGLPWDAAKALNAAIALCEDRP